MFADFTIRAMAAQDLDGVLAIAGHCIEAPQWPRRVYEEILLAGPDTAVARFGLVAHAQGVLAGFAISSLLRVESLAELETIAVHPGFRRRGIGARLLASSVDSAGRAGAAAIRLEVRESNAAALSLYAGCGFQRVGRRRFYYANPVEDALLFQAPLGVATKTGG